MIHTISIQYRGHRRGIHVADTPEFKRPNGAPALKTPQKCIYQVPGYILLKTSFMYYSYARLSISLLLARVFLASARTPPRWNIVVRHSRPKVEPPTIARNTQNIRTK